MTKNRNQARKTKRIVRTPATKFAQLKKRLATATKKKSPTPKRHC